MGFQFSKEDRLSSRKSISELFASGKSFVEMPFRVNWKIVPYDEGSPAKVAFSVPKKNFKKAVDRNKIKRQSREAYRLNSEELKKTYSERNQSIHLMLIYLASDKQSYEEIEAKIILILRRLTQINE